MPLPAARADKAADFRRHYEEALRLYQQDHLSEAIREFEAAYALKQLPRLLYNLGRAHFQLGHARDALDLFDRFLKLEPGAPADVVAKVQDNMAQARAMIDAAEHIRRGEPAPPPQTTTPPPDPGEVKPEPKPEPKPPAEVPPPGAERRPPPVVIVTPAPILRRPAPPKPQALTWGRPRWRVITGFAAAGAGLVVTGFGAGLLGFDGRCGAAPVAPALECDQVFATGVPGGVLLGVGLALVGDGVLLALWPPRKTPAGVR